MRIDLDVPDRLGAYALDAALEGLVEVSSAELAHPEVSGHVPELYTSGVRYEREHGTERWLTPSQVLAAGVGDCEDLASWRAAELRVSGEDVDARARVIRSGPRTWHAVVERGDGSIEDPSRRLGMGGPNDRRGAAVGSLGDWELTVTKRNGLWNATLSRDGAGVSGTHPYGHEAIARACELGHTVGELGQIPGLDILARVARGALEAAIPPPPRLPTSYGGPYPSAPSPYLSPAPWASPLPMTGPMSSDVQRLASQISRLATSEATRKLRDAQRAVDTVTRAASSSATTTAPYTLPFAALPPSYAPSAPALAPRPVTRTTTAPTTTTSTT